MILRGTVIIIITTYVKVKECDVIESIILLTEVEISGKIAVLQILNDQNVTERGIAHILKGVHSSEWLPADDDSFEAGRAGQSSGVGVNSK